jgi:hypothetical protein
MKSEILKMPFRQLNPIIYEINTGIWLNELSRKFSNKINLSNIPASEYDELAKAGFSAIWMMGVWKRSKTGISIAKAHQGIMKELHEALPDIKDEDITGSPYCIRDYLPEIRFGGAKGLAILRKELANRGMELILDYVPNHVAPDHPWTKTHPEYFISGTEEEVLINPDHYIHSCKNIFAKARDPFYPPWPDVLQVNVFNEGLRNAMADTLIEIAGQCDGIRCDMAMLVMNDIFARTWAGKCGPVPEQDFWNFIIPAVKKKFPGFKFIAESYWDTEQALLGQDFDFCYDKKYYDFLKEGAEKAITHLTGMIPHQQKLLRFLENHDEPRAAGLFPAERHMAMAMASLTLPGARLFHDGQFEGRSVKVPVFLARRQEESKNTELKLFYEKLLKILHIDAMAKGQWYFCEVSGWPDNQTCRNILAWEWIFESESLLIAINLSDQPAQAHVKSGFAYFPGRTYQLYDVISGELYLRDGEEMSTPGLYVVLKKWGMHAFQIEH